MIPIRGRIPRSATASRRATPGSSRGFPAIRVAGLKKQRTCRPWSTRRSNEWVVVADNGRRRKISKRQAIITQLVNRSAQADLKATQILLGIIQDIERRNETELAETTFDAADEKVLEQLKARLGKGSGS